MTADRKIRPEPTTGDAFLGVGTLGILLVDIVLLVAFLIGIQSNQSDNRARFWSVVLFLVALLILGMIAGFGIVLRSLGARGGLAGQRPPFIFMGTRFILLLMPVPLMAATEWGGFASMVFMAGYIFPATLLLLLLSAINVGRHPAKR